MNIRNKVKALAIQFAQKEALETGKKYGECISKALDKACLECGVTRKQFIKMFI